MDACHSTQKVTTTSSYKETKTETKTAYSPVSESSPRISRTKKSPIKKEEKISEAKENSNAIIATYAAKLGVSKTDIHNYKLYAFINDWYGTPYKYAGRTKTGVDCSDFASILLQNVYNITISGTAAAMYKQCKPIKPSELREGDLVFFKIKSKSFSHMGVYLQNHKFVHASVHAGVIIDDLGEAYYMKCFRAAGRVVVKKKV